MLLKGDTQIWIPWRCSGVVSYLEVEILAWSMVHAQEASFSSPLTTEYTSSGQGGSVVPVTVQTIYRSNWQFEPILHINQVQRVDRLKIRPVDGSTSWTDRFGLVCKTLLEGIIKIYCLDASLLRQAHTTPLLFLHFKFCIVIYTSSSSY